MPTKRTPRDRARKASNRINSEAVKLFARLESVPLVQRMGYRYRHHDQRLAKMLGLWAENFLDAHRLNDGFLIRHPPKYDFYQASWERVCAARRLLLELAGLPPDEKDGPLYPDFDYDAYYAYDDEHDFPDLDPPASPGRSPEAKRAARG